MDNNLFKITFILLFQFFTSCSSNSLQKKGSWEDKEFEDFLTKKNILFKKKENGYLYSEKSKSLYDDYFAEFLKYETKNSQKGITNLKSKRAYFSYYANDFLVEPNLGNVNFKNRFSFNIIKIDKLRSIVAFASIYYNEDKKIDLKKINLDSLFLNVDHEFVEIKGKTIIYPKYKIKHKRSFFDFATPSSSTYGGEKFNTDNFKYVYDSIQGFIKNKKKKQNPF
ncbi:hypothetical protein FLACOL_01958 [Flavobacterium columnare]|uniref:Lipoprotein n=1 Tax=Flavobacterium columnare TaxID=996 RepID=A0A2N9PC79_9FLAO|nr:hypothetical protein [Flavobacterium columnare]SPE77944.1 hypothetical protein FLACOL_01958 [Flavobacterium columnare]